MPIANPYVPQFPPPSIRRHVNSRINHFVIRKITSEVLLDNARPTNFNIPRFNQVLTDDRDTLETYRDLARTYPTTNEEIY